MGGAREDAVKSRFSASQAPLARWLLPRPFGHRVDVVVTATKAQWRVLDDGWFTPAQRKVKWAKVFLRSHLTGQASGHAALVATVQFVVEQQGRNHRAETPSEPGGYTSRVWTMAESLSWRSLGNRGWVIMR